MTCKQTTTPRERGGADYWYHRARVPNHILAGVRIGRDAMSAEEIAEYNKGYDVAEAMIDQKEWD